MEFAADYKRDRMVFSGRMGADDSRKSVPVGDRKSLVAIDLGLLDKLMGMRGSFEEREVRFAVEFDVGRHNLAIYLSGTGAWTPGRVGLGVSRIGG